MDMHMYMNKIMNKMKSKISFDFLLLFPSMDCQFFSMCLLLYFNDKLKPQFFFSFDYSPIYIFTTFTKKKNCTLSVSCLLIDNTGIQIFGYPLEIPLDTIVYLDF